MLRILSRALFMLAVPSSVLFSCGSTDDGSESTGGSGGTSPGGVGGSGGAAGSPSGGGGAASGSASGGASAGAQTGGTPTSGGTQGGTGSGGNTGTAGTGTAPTECGTQTCSAAQYCVIPCCGGAPPQCTPKPSGGTCPPGTHAGCSFNTGQCADPANCCQQDPCTPPPRFCSDQMPVGCSLVVGRSCTMACA
jgi:hypothetical protein